MKRKLGVILALVFIIGIIAGCGTTQATVDNSSTNSKSSSSSSSSDKKQKLTDLAIGTTIDLNGLKVTVDAVADGPKTLTGQPTKKITVTYKNESTVSKPYNEFDWKTENVAGDRKDTGMPFIDSSYATLQSGEIAKGGTKTGDVYTESMDFTKVVYVPSFFSGDDQLIFWKVQ